MLKISNLVILFISLSCAVLAQSKDNSLQLSKQFVQAQLEDASQQIKFLAQSVKENDIPTTYSNGKHINWGSSWWCSGFYPGTVLYLYEYTKDPEFLNEAKTKLKYLEKEKLNTRTHDLGFMLFCSFGNALRLTQDSLAYNDILLTGAQSLSSRFREAPQVIRSWDGNKFNYPVIIDNMMNLEFLTQASKISGDKKFYDIAVAHANTTMKNHFRKDYSSYHVVDYNETTGEVLHKKTAQGAFDESAWSRGQAWALYGYVMMFRETGNSKYLKQAQGIAKFYLNHPNLPKDMIPFWDMDQNKLNPNSVYYSQRELRDASSAAVFASALLELSQYTKGKDSQKYIHSAEVMLKSLSEAPYKAAYKENGGFILKHSVGSIPHKTEVDVPLTYADYYYVEALIRYLRLLNGEKIV